MGSCVDNSRIVTQRELREVERTGLRREVTAVILSHGERLPCDALVVAVGMQPNLGILHGTGIATARGVLVDDRMRTSAPDIFAAGDLAEIEISGVRKVNLIHPNAVATGEITGRVMAGADARLVAHLEDMNVLTLFGRSFLSAGALEGGHVLERRVPVAAIPDILSPRFNYGATLQPR